MAQKVVAYFRVSTDRQGKSGLGLEGQTASVREHITRTRCELVGTYTEVETGKRDTLDNRPELQKAIAHSRRSKATLIVAKLDRLARSVAVTSALHQSDVDFICVDNPSANRLTVQILAAVAEAEGRAISERTKAALAAFKARGGALGGSRPECRNLSQAAREKGARSAAVTRKRQAVEAYADILPEIVSLRKEGHSLRDIANDLNGKGFNTRRGKPWNATQISRLLGKKSPSLRIG